ncbi:hypothetical protein PYCC9005_002873 [Savitreella phatthalungensis]
MSQDIKPDSAQQAEQTATDDSLAVPLPVPLDSDDVHIDDESAGMKQIKPEDAAPGFTSASTDAQTSVDVGIPVPNEDTMYEEEVEDDDADMADESANLNGAPAEGSAPLPTNGTGRKPGPGRKPKAKGSAPGRRNAPRARPEPATPTQNPAQSRATRTPKGEAVPQQPIILGNLRFIENLVTTGGEPGLAVPATIDPVRYKQECEEAAIASRLSPTQLSSAELDLFGRALGPNNHKLYLEMRNAILRLWVKNTKIWVGEREAKGVAAEEHHMRLCSAIWEFLTRHGYINFGCVTLPSPGPPSRAPSRERVVVVIGAGIAGLSAARHLEGLFRQFEFKLPSRYRVRIVEANERIGGRVHSYQFQTVEEGRVDLGAQIVTGFSRGNPLNAIIREQLELPFHSLTRARNDAIYLSTGQRASTADDDRAQGLFNLLLEIAAKFRVTQEQQVLADLAAVDGSAVGQDEHKAAPYADKLLGVTKTSGTKAADLIAADPLATLRNLGFDIPADAVMPEITEAPTLGATMAKALQQLETLIQLTAAQRELLDWQWANMEYACGTNLDSLSLAHWDQDDGNEFEGHHAMIIGGYSQLARNLALAPTKIELKTGAQVSRITEGGVLLSDGEAIAADRVVVTSSLGVLKAGDIEFDPPLPEWKLNAIRKLGFGLLNKVVLVYDEQFWDNDSDMIGHCPQNGAPGSTRGRFYVFWNCTEAAQRPTLVALMAGDAAFECETATETELAAEATDILSSIYPGKAPLPTPRETIVTQWAADPFAKGSYSFVGPEATGADYDAMAKPVGERVFFAGEACCRTHPSTVHGAYLSGLNAARMVFDTVAGAQRVTAGGKDPLLPGGNKYVGDSFLATPVAGRQITAADLSADDSASVDGQDDDDDDAEDDDDDDDSSVVGGKRKRGRPSRGGRKNGTSGKSKRARKSMGGLDASGAPLQPPPPSPQFPKFQGDPDSVEGIKLQLSDIDKLREHERELKVTTLAEAEMGGPRPPPPKKPRLNPYLTYLRDSWDQCRAVSDEEQRDALRRQGASAAAIDACKATKNQIRATVGRMWRELPLEGKKPWLDLMDKMKSDYDVAKVEYDASCSGWEEAAKKARKQFDDAVADELAGRVQPHERIHVSDDELELRAKLGRMRQENRKKRRSDVHVGASTGSNPSGMDDSLTSVSGLHHDAAPSHDPMEPYRPASSLDDQRGVEAAAAALTAFEPTLTPHHDHLAPHHHHPHAYPHPHHMLPHDPSLAMQQHNHHQAAQPHEPEPPQLDPRLSAD